MLRLLLFWGIFFATSLFDTVPIAQNFTLLPSSRLMIHGSSNVNKFTCVFAMENFKGLKLEYSPEATNYRTPPLKFPISCFDCGGKLINKDLREILKEKTYPELSIRLLDITPLTSSKAYIGLELEIAGVKKKYQLPVFYKFVDRHHTASGKLKLNIEDFKIEQPKRMMGLVVVDTNIDIDFNIDFKE